MLYPCDEETITVMKTVKPNCNGIYQDYTTIPYGDFVTYKIDVFVDISIGMMNLSVKDDLPQLDGLIYNNSYVMDGDGHYIPSSEYDFVITDDYLIWNFSYVDPFMHYQIFYCADAIGCDLYENTVNVTARVRPCCPEEWIYCNDSALVYIICPSGVSMDKQVSLDGVTWVDDGVETFIGDLVWFKLHIKNLDFEDVVEGVTVYDILPDFLDLEEVIDCDGGIALIENDTELRWFFNHLDASEERNIIFKTSVVDFGSDINLACVYDCNDSDEWCDDVLIDVVDGMFVDKQVSLDDEGPWLENVSVIPGDIVFWNITITYYDDSYPPLVLYHIIVNDTLPDNISYLNDSTIILKSNGWSKVLNPDIDGNILTWDLSNDDNCTLLNGSWLSIMFSTLVEDDAAGILENMVNVSAYRCDDSILFEQDNAIIDVEEVINHKPTIENPVPEHNAVNISIDATLEIDVNDSDDDLLSVKFYDASDDSLIKSYSSVNPPASKTASWNDLDYNTSYSWYVTVDDGIISTPVRSENYSFTTELEPDNMPPVIGEESPASGSNNIDVNPYLSVEVSDPDIGDMLSITFYTSSGTVIGADSCTSDCTAQVYWPGRSYDRSYSWYVTVSDGIEEVRGPVTGYWSFNTEQMPDIDLNIRLNGGLGVTLEIENGGADNIYQS